MLSLLQTPKKSQAGLEPAQNPKLNFVDWRWTVVITTTP